MEFFKKRSTTKVSFIPPTPYVKDGPKQRDGAILIELVPHTDDSKRVWDKALFFAVSALETAKFESLDKGIITEFTLIHDPNKGKQNTSLPIKTLKVNMAVSEKKIPYFYLNILIGEEKRTSALSPDEFHLISDIMVQMRPYMVSFLPISSSVAKTQIQGEAEAPSNEEPDLE